MKEIKPGTEITAEISGLAYGGDSVSKVLGMDIYIPYGVPGSKVSATITEVKRHFARARITKVISASSHYVQPMCPHFYECGGCDYLNVSLEMQLKFKNNLINQIIAEAGISKAPMGPMVNYEKPYNYRNRAEFKPVMSEGKIALGFNAAKSKMVVPVRNCLLLKPVLNEAASIIRNSLSASKIKVSVFDPKTMKGYLRHVVVKTNEAGELLVTFVVNSREIKPFLKDAAAALAERIKKLSGVMVNFNMEETSDVYGERSELIAGKPFIIEKATGCEFRIGPKTFFQINVKMLEAMTSFIAKHIQKGYSVLDLYGGMGALSFPFREKLRSLTVVESDRDSVDSLIMNIKKTGTRNVTAVCSGAEEYGVKMINSRKHDLLICDPPRAGLHPKLLTAIKRNGPGRFVYISCNPQSFGRDIEELKDNYKLVSVIPLDQFAQTYHVEVMSYLERKTRQAGDEEE